MTLGNSPLSDKLARLKIVPVIVIEDPSAAAALASALTDGGLPCAEITFRTAGAAEALRRIRDAVPEVLLGAGTVLTVAQAREARSAGATFIVAPGFNPAVVEHCLEHEIPVFPGICTPTDIEAALAHALTTVKFFPAEAIGGLKYLKAIAAPYGMMRFVPTGGINADNLRPYLAFERVVACGGSWMAPADWIASKAFDRIRDETARAVRAARGEAESPRAPAGASRS
jgi:2-dehydro-3-deoxyphosphogluconate aldolase / (4S)-4-hydroxy-2-oxoglutarate aldolase